MLASYLLIKDSTAPLTSSDGAIIGVFTGIVAAVVKTVVELIMAPLNKRFVQGLMERFSEYFEEMPSGFEDLFEAHGDSLLRDTLKSSTQGRV